MYEDTWYSFVPELSRGGGGGGGGSGGGGGGGRSASGPGHRRRESLLQQPTGPQPDAAMETLDALLEDDADEAGEAEDADLLQARAAGLLRRTRSFPSARPARPRAKWAAAEAGQVAGQAGGQAGGQASRREAKLGESRRRPRRRQVTLEALCIADSRATAKTSTTTNVRRSRPDEALEWQKVREKARRAAGGPEAEAALLAASRQAYAACEAQLALAERHLGGLVGDTDRALGLLAALADAFRAVDAQTTSFQAQCDGLLAEQRRLQALADAVGTDLHYYGYLDTATRRLNAPGASRLADTDELADILASLDACIQFMADHPDYRDAETYLARYQALLTKSLHLLEVGFTARLESVAGDLARQIAATASDAAQHALAYGRFEERLVDDDAASALVPNVQQAVIRAYTPQGAPRGGPRGHPDDDGDDGDDHPTRAIYVNTATSIFRTYLRWRDQVLRPLAQKEVDAFQAEAKKAAAAAAAAAAASKNAESHPSVETAARGLVKQTFERAYHEALLFAKVFGVDPQYSARADSVFAALRAYRSDLVNAVNVAPLATHLQTALAAADLPVVCHVLGWITHEYLEYEEEEGEGEEDDDDDDEDENGDGGRAPPAGRRTSYLAAHSRQMAARLLAEHLWAFADARFEADIARTLAKAPVDPEALTIRPPGGTGGTGAAAAAAGPDAPPVPVLPAAHAYPPVRRAIELLVLFDQAMPKERCQRNSPVVFKIVRETIRALQRAEARIQSARLATDADLFMIVNLLLLKNELLSLEIGDLRSDGSGGGGGGGGVGGGGVGAGTLQHFGQIWDAVSAAQNLVGYFSTFLPGQSLWRGHGHGGGPSAAASAALVPPPRPATSHGGFIGKALSVAGSRVSRVSGAGTLVAGLGSGTTAEGPASDRDVGEQLDEALRRAITAFTQRWGRRIHEATSRPLGGKNVVKIERELDALLQTAFRSQPEVVAKLKEAIQDQARAAGSGRRLGVA